MRVLGVSAGLLLCVPALPVGGGRVVSPPLFCVAGGRFQGWLQHVLRPEQQLKSLLGCIPV